MAAAAAGGNKLHPPGMSCLADCEVVLVLDNQSKHSACKNNLARVSEYFQRMFLDEFKEKNSNEIEIKRVSQADLSVFLSALEPFKPLPSDVGSLCSLIFLADRFMCPKLKKELKVILEKESMYSLHVEDKLKLLEAADKNKGESTEILEACIRLCTNLTINQVCCLKGRVSHGTLAAALALIGKMLQCEQLSAVNISLSEHHCSLDRKWHSYTKIMHGQLVCHACSSTVDISADLVPSFAKMKEIPIEKELLS